MNKLLEKFQNNASEALIRNSNLLDILTKITDASSRVNRSVIKSITQCGCLSIATQKAELPENPDYEMLKQFRSEHLTGDICPVCKEKIEEEIGKLEFFIAGLCTAVNLSLQNVVEKEDSRLESLGKFMLY